MTFNDALRGYAHPVLQRDGFRCVYCGLDGTEDLSNWLHLSWDHLLPKGHPDRDELRFIVAACRFCNEAHNRTRFDVDGKTPDEIVALKKEAVLGRRAEYQEFWQAKVAQTGKGASQR
jgi:5-methylcytosine-specific restriction endonuclease McrA